LARPAPKMPPTPLTFLVGAAGLAGLPLFPGFFSKDAILAAALHEGHRGLFVLLLAGAFMTAFYTFRLVFLAFFGGPRMSHEVAHHVHESPAVMTVPLIVLSILTIVAGLAVGIPSPHGTAFEQFLAPVLPRHEAEHSSGTAFALLVVSVGFVLAGIAIAWVMYGRGEVRAERIGVPRNPIHALVLNKYY